MTKLLALGSLIDELITQNVRWLMLYLRQNYQVFCPACGTTVETNEHGEHYCPDCGLWYTDQQLFGYQPRHLTPLMQTVGRMPEGDYETRNSNT